MVTVRGDLDPDHAVRGGIGLRETPWLSRGRDPVTYNVAMAGDEGRSGATDRDRESPRTTEGEERLAVIGRGDGIQIRKLRVGACRVYPWVREGPDRALDPRFGRRQGLPAGLE